MTLQCGKKLLLAVKYRSFPSLTHLCAALRRSAHGRVFDEMRAGTEKGALSREAPSEEMCKTSVCGTTHKHAESREEKEKNNRKGKGECEQGKEKEKEGDRHAKGMIHEG